VPGLDTGSPCDDAVLRELVREKIECWECEDDVEAWDGGADLREFSGKFRTSGNVRSIWEDTVEDWREGEGIEEDVEEEMVVDGGIKESSEPDCADAVSSREGGMEESSLWEDEPEASRLATLGSALKPAPTIALPLFPGFLAGAGDCPNASNLGCRGVKGDAAGRFIPNLTPRRLGVDILS